MKFKRKNNQAEQSPNTGYFNPGESLAKITRPSGLPREYHPVLTIGGAKSLPSNVKVLTFGHSYGTTEINIASQVLALPSK